MKRYVIVSGFVEEHELGHYVDYEDHARVIAERDSLLKSIMEACNGSGCLNAHELRHALDRAKESDGMAWNSYFRMQFQRDVLREEVNAWRGWYKLCGCPLDKHDECECEELNRVARVNEAMATTDRTKALTHNSGDPA